MRLRPLSEAECYTRCYGGKPGDRVTVIRIVSREERRQRAATRRERERRAA